MLDLNLFAIISFYFRNCDISGKMQMRLSHPFLGRKNIAYKHPLRILKGEYSYILEELVNVQYIEKPELRVPTCSHDFHGFPIV